VRKEPLDLGPVLAEPTPHLGRRIVAVTEMFRRHRELVLDDQRLRNEICWSVFDC
jgi:hypothetical protein